MRLTAPLYLSPPTDTAPAVSRHPVRNRLWKAAIVMLAILLMLIGMDVSARLRDPSPKLSLGHDFLPSYTAGLLTRQGNPRGMYDSEAISTAEYRIIKDAELEITGRYGPWLNPPFFAWLFAPLSMLPYRQAALFFLIFNLAIFAVTLTLLTRIVINASAPGRAASAVRSMNVRVLFKAGACRPGFAGVTRDRPSDPSDPTRPDSENEPPLDLMQTTSPGAQASRDNPIDWRTAALVPLMTILPLPVWQVLGHQQNTFISLFLITAAVICWRSGRGLLAGIIAGLLFFKPQLAAVFAIVLVIGVGWRALTGISITGITLLAITLITMPGCIYDFLHRLPVILHWQQVELPYNWGRQITLHSFWRLIIQGHMRGETWLVVKLLWWISWGAVASAMTLAIWRFHTGDRSPIARDRLIAAAIVSMPMLMPYYMDYDLLLLALPAVLLAAEWIRHPQGITRADYVLLVIWLIFGFESHINPSLAGGSHYNLIVPILAVLSALHIWRCVRIRPAF